MKYLAFPLILLFLLSNCLKETTNSSFITKDIDNFWKAYDQIITTKDSVQQMNYLQELFLNQATKGQKAMIQARRYQAEEYVEAINSYPLFWNSIRTNTLKAKTYAKEIERGADKLRTIYPALKTAEVYFTMGVFRSPGTTMDSLVLIGAELAMADEQVNTSELPKRLGYVKNYCRHNPINDIAFLNVHELIHTQQKSTRGDVLLVQTMYEGAAEFIAEKATGQASITPAIAYGKANEEKIKEKFTQEMFSYAYDNWLWNDLNNEFKTRDLGYFIGYAICEKYYNKANDKQQAIKEIIELEYDDRAAIEAFVDKTKYFEKSIVQLKSAYDESRPKVLSIKPFNNGDQKVSPNTSKITVEFSKQMNKEARGFEYGPLGESNVLSVKNYLGFSEDGRSVSFEIKLEDNKRYQVLLSERFRSVDGISLDPFLIDIKTGTQE